MRRLQRFPDDQRAACSGPQHLPMVDEAYRSPGGAAAQRMRRHICPTCPVARQCLGEAMTDAEWGVWGGTSLLQRSLHGAPPTRVRG